MPSEAISNPSAEANAVTPSANRWGRAIESDITGRGSPKRTPWISIFITMEKHNAGQFRNAQSPPNSEHFKSSAFLKF